MDEDYSGSLDGNSLTNLRVIDLKQELEKRGLSKSGSKKDLIKRLKQQLEFEKLCEETKSTGECEIKLQLDAVTEQNEFVQQYLAQQQKIYAEQKEVKRLVQLEEIHKSGDEQENCDTKCEADSPSQNVKEKLKLDEPNQKQCNEQCDTSSGNSSEPSSSYDVSEKNAEDLIKVEVLQKDSLVDTQSRFCDTLQESVITGMERPKRHSTVSNVPYSLSDIQLPDSPGKCLVKPSKSKASDVKKNSHSKRYKSRFDVEKLDHSDSCDAPSNGVSSTQCLNLIDSCKDEKETQNADNANKLKESEDTVNSNTLEEHKSSKLEEQPFSEPDVKENIVNVAPFEGEEKPLISAHNDGEQSINIDVKITEACEEKNSPTSVKPEADPGVKCMEEKMELEEKDNDSSQDSEGEKTSDSDDHADNLKSRSPAVRKHSKSESSDSTSQSSESSSEMDVYAKHSEDLQSSFHKSSETKDSLALISNEPETKEIEEKISPSLKSSQPSRRLKIKRNNIVSCDKIIEPEVLEKDTKDEIESSVDSLEVPKEQKEVPEVPTKPVEPIQVKISNRKLSLSSRKLNRKTATENDKQEEICLKKSRWGSFASSLPKSSISISTDSLKNLIPDFKLITGPVSANDTDDTLNPVFTHDTSPARELKLPVPNVAMEIITEDVRIEPSKAMLKQLPSPLDEYETKQVTEKCLLSQGPASRILFIKNLVRPFTLLQLKELLKQTGNMIEEHFWIDKIKSKCFVEYETEEEAINTRQALHDTKWPSSNPKILSVEFATREELDLHRNGSDVPLILPPLPSSNIAEVRETRTVLPAEDYKKKERDRRKEKAKPRLPVREWDKDKLVQDSPERERESKEFEKGKSSEKKEKKESKKRPNEDTPAKLLDDLFQKTKSSPCIYWLPLTDEQVKQKKNKEEEEKRQRILEREKRNQLREQEEAERRNRRTRPARKSREKENRRSQNRSRSPANRRR